MENERVQLIGGNQCGVVLERSDAMVHVLWGVVTQPEGKPGLPISTWHAPYELETYPDPVVEPDAVIEREKRNRQKAISGGD